MNYLREAGRSIKDDDNSHKFILIDKNARKQPNTNSSRHNIITANPSRLSSNFNTVSSETNEFLASKAISIDTEADKLQKLRKKMFWNRTNSNVDSLSHQPVISLTKKPENKILNSFKQADCQTNGGSIQFRSTSLSHASSCKQVRSESVSVVKSSGLYSKKTSIPLNELNSHKLSSNYSQSIANSTLKPFYSKLKKSHLFGVKLEKVCGIYSAANGKLPNQIMVSNY